MWPPCLLIKLSVSDTHKKYKLEYILKIWSGRGWKTNKQINKKRHLSSCLLSGGRLPGFGLLQPILLGSKTLGACRCPNRLAAQLIPASGRGQMCQSLLGLATFSPPGSQCRRIQLRYNNLTPLKQLDPLAWQPPLCFMPLRTSCAIKNYSQQHLNCFSIHFGALPLPAPSISLIPPFSSLGFHVHLWQGCKVINFFQHALPLNKGLFLPACLLRLQGQLPPSGIKYSWCQCRVNWHSCT